jgi:hypothetical protein
MTTRILAALGIMFLSGTGLAAAQRSQPASQTGSHDEHAVTHDASAESHAFTLNVFVSDAGFEPAALFIPVEQRIQLVLRNRDRSEHHYRVAGLAPRDLRWISEPGSEAPADGDEEDHSRHHARSFVATRATSPAGITPTGDEVHAYVSVARGVDVLLFTATNTGAFTVRCNLHPDETARLTVFETGEGLRRLMPWGVR